MKIGHKINMRKSLCCALLSLAFCSLADAQTIAEKKAGAGKSSKADVSQEMQKRLGEVNRDINQAHEELHHLYAEVNKLYEENAPPISYRHLLDQINAIRNEVDAIENSWRELAVEGGRMEDYALWHQPETTIGQLVMDYGSHDYVYLISPEIAGRKLSINSNLPIPRASWNEMLDLILNQNGVGFKQLNPYLRELYVLEEDKSGIKLITNNPFDLELIPPNARVAFILTPEPAEVKRTWLFLEKFVNPNSTVLQHIGRDIIIVGQMAEVKDLLKLNDFISTNKGDKEYRIFPVTRVDVEEMAKILSAIFEQEAIQENNLPQMGPPFKTNKPGGPQPSPQNFPKFQQTSSRNVSEANGLRVIPLAHVARALFLVGTKEEIRKAEQIIRQVEAQVGEARQRVIYWYTVRNSDPEELAQVLYKIYNLMVMTGPGPIEGIPGMPPPPVELTPVPTPSQIASEVVAKERQYLPAELYQTSYYQQGNYVVNPAPVAPGKTKDPKITQNRDNFIVDPKSGSIAMVVEADILPKLKELIKKLDVPKRMVRLEVLLFERRLAKQNNFGLNLLRIGSCADMINATCAEFNEGGLASGILDFIISRKPTCTMPAYDLIYRFLMTQDDIQINASPSVTTINQTPATVSFVEEISLNTGIYNVETAKGNTLQEAFTRVQYGVIIDITPTIHMAYMEEGDEPNYVTLETDITFDTIQAGLNADRPDVFRRHLTNEVRVPDGQTVILGGLRRKNTDNFKESIPFFGELPAIGKLFSMTELHEDDTEMFIFITPTIISEPLDDMERIKCEEMKRRPGDIPDFLCCLVAARNQEQNQVLRNSMDILLGPMPDRCYSPGYFRPSACGSGAGYVMGGGWSVETYPGSSEYDGCE